jgi:hypothetical protein
VQRFAFDESALDAIGAELGAPVKNAAYRVRGAAVYEVRVPCRSLPGANVLVVLWPSLARVDLRLQDAAGNAVFAVTRHGISAVEIYPQVEVMFRRAVDGVLFVTRHGVVGASDGRIAR